MDTHAIIEVHPLFFVVLGANHISSCAAGSVVSWECRVSYVMDNSTQLILCFSSKYWDRERFFQVDSRLWFANAQKCTNRCEYSTCNCMRKTKALLQLTLFFFRTISITGCFDSSSLLSVLLGALASCVTMKRLKWSSNAFGLTKNVNQCKVRRHSWERETNPKPALAM